MIKQISNLKGITINTNRVIENDTTIYRNQPTNELKVGQSLLVRFTNISLSGITRIANAKMILPCSGHGSFEISVFRNTQNYGVTTVHGNNKPDYDETNYIHYEQFVIGKSGGFPEQRMIEIDLTGLFNKWKQDNATNLSFTIKCTSSATLTVYGFTHTSLLKSKLFTLSYANTDTFSPAFDYLMDQVPFGGHALINTFTGKLAHQFDVFQNESKKFPIKFSCYYLNRTTGITMRNRLIGNWRTNFDYGFKIESETITVVSPEGSISYFEKTSREDASRYDIYIGAKTHCFINPIDNAYIVEDIISNGYQNYKMYDISKNIMEFNSNNVVLRITKEDGSFINFGYNINNHVTSITSSDGYQVTLSYVSGRVQYVNFINEDKRISLTYAGNGLASVRLQNIVRVGTYTGVSISYKTLMWTSFVHEGTKLIRVTDEKTLEGLLFEYSGDQVTKITNTIKNGTSFMNRSYRGLEYRETYTRIFDFEVNNHYLVHDTYGMLLQSIDSAGNAVSKKHQSIGIDGVARSVVNNSGIIPNFKNSIVDASFELIDIEGTSAHSNGWKVSGNQNAVMSSQDAVKGKYSLNIKGGYNTYVYQELSRIQKINFSISFLAKTVDIVGNADVMLSVTYRMKIVVPNADVILHGAHYDFIEGNTYYRLSTTGFSKKVDITNTNGKWMPFALNDILAVDLHELISARLSIRGTHSSGDIFVDAMKYDNELSSANYNLLIGADMEHASSVPSGFVKSSNCTSLDTIISQYENQPYYSILSGKRFRFTQSKNITKYLQRSLMLKGSSGESLTFAFWGKSDFNNGSNLWGSVVLKKGDETVQSVQVRADKALIQWQLVSLSLTTSRPYDKIVVTIYYTGLHPCFIDAIALYRDNYGSQFKYNEKGNLLEQINHASSRTYKTNGSKIVESTDESGEQYQYIYDVDGRVSKVIDSKDNKIDLTYDSRGNRIKSKVTSDNQTLALSNTFNTSNLVTSATDELGHVTSFTYDAQKRLRTQTAANGLVTTNSYDDLNNLIAIVKSKSGTSMGASYQYNTDNTLKKIICGNGTNYEFIYDAFGRVIQIKLNNQPFVSYEYGLVKNGVTTDDITKQTIGDDVYEFLYNTKRLLVQIKLNGIVLVHYEYDGDSNIIKKTVESSVSYYDYDTKGKLLRETRGNGDLLNYDYDNLEQLQKAIIDINSMHRSYDYEYLNEYNEYHGHNLKMRLDKAFNDDIIDFNALNSGLYGAKAQSVWGTYATYGNKKVFRLHRMTSKIIYPLDTVNANRNTVSQGGIFSRYDWKRQFEYNKTMFGWFRFTGDIESGHKVFAFGNDTTDQYYVTLSKSGSNFVFRLYADTYQIKACTIPATSNLVFIGLKLSKGAERNETDYVFTVNNTYQTGTISSRNFVSNLTRFILGDRNILLGSTINNPFIQDVALLSIGAYDYTNETFQAIRTQETKFLENNFKPKTGVSFINPKTYRNFEVMTLNGTFKSTNNQMPTAYEFIDDTFKLDKIKLFKYDEHLERHVYGSYSTAQGLGTTKGLLTYKHGLTDIGTLSLNVKLDNISSNNKTIFEFKDATASRLKIYRSSTGTLMLKVNDNSYSTNLSLPFNQWHRVLLTFINQGSSPKIIIYLNDFNNSKIINDAIDLTDTKLVIGSSLLDNDTPTEHIEGTLEMLALQKVYWDGKSTEINRIVNGEQLLSVKTEIDVMGRSNKDIIDTGIPMNIGQGTTKKLITQYAYNQTEAGNTSLQVYETQGFDGIIRNYAYDKMGNITKISLEDSKTDENPVYEYQYDLLSRLVEEFNPGENSTIKYTYSSNNNIQKATHYTGRTTEVIKTETYNYHTDYKDKLDYISIEQNGNKTNKSITYDSNHVPSNFMGKSLSWKGRRLERINGDVIRYAYNESGIRTSKTINDITTDYHLIGDRVISLTKGEDKLFFHYNERDMLVGLEYDNENYFYHRDLTGIITSIVDKNGDIMISYIYDAWGNWLNKSSAAKTTIGTTLLTLNPFIYKGYIYDEESGFYYLKSRYYAPEVRKFINVDSVIGDVGNIENYNLFAYCGNNPVMYLDSTGNSPEWWHWVASGAMVVAGVALMFTPLGILGGALVTAGVSSMVGGYLNEQSGGSFTAGWVGGAVAGFVSGLGAGMASSLYYAATISAGGATFYAMGSFAVAGTLGFLGNFGGSIITQSWDNKQIDFTQAFVSGTIGGILNVAFVPFSAGANVLSKFGYRTLSVGYSILVETISQVASYGIDRVINEIHNYRFNRLTRRFG